MIINARERILGAAVRVFEEHGSRGATTRRIAEAAGVNEVTLFRHFGSKERLIREALEWAATPSQIKPKLMLPSEPRDPQAELTTWCALQLRLLHERRMLIRTAMAEFEENPDVTTCASQIPERVANALNDYVVKLQQKGMASIDCDTRAATALLMGAVFADAMNRDITPAWYPFTLEEAAERYVTLFARAIGLACDYREQGNAR